MFKPLLLPHFLKQLREYGKKYFHLETAVHETLTTFQKDRAILIRPHVYKIRLRSPDIRRGKSKSFRLIVLIVHYETYLVPVVLYFKGDQRDISKRELIEYLKIAVKELKAYKA